MFTFFASTCMAIWKLSRSKVKWGARLLGQFVLFYTLCKKYLMTYCCHQNCKIHAEWHKESWAIHSLRNFLFFFLIISPKLVCYIGLKCSEINAATLFFHILQVLNSSYSLTYVIRYSTILKAGTKNLCHTCVSYIPKQTNLCLFSLRVAALHTQPNVHANSYPHRCTEGRGVGVDGTPPQSFWYFAVFLNDFGFIGKPLIFSTRWGIFYVWWCWWRPVTSPRIVGILDFTKS